MKNFLKIMCAAFLVCTAMVKVGAHELQSNRATLVLRDNQHLALSFFVDYTRVLHRVLAPQQSFEEFVLLYAALDQQLFQAQLLTAQRQLQSRTAVVLGSGQSAALNPWVWPDASATHTLLQQRAMQLVIAPADHSHTAQTEIRTETTSSTEGDFSAITLQLPDEFQDVLVVSYRPKQVWVSPGKGLATVQF